MTDHEELAKLRAMLAPIADDIEAKVHARPNAVATLAGVLFEHNALTRSLQANTTAAARVGVVLHEARAWLHEAQKFLAFFDAWAASSEGAAGPLFDAMLAARERLCERQEERTP